MLLKALSSIPSTGSKKRKVVKCSKTKKGPNGSKKKKNA
jgi:hypothetical protein